MRFSPTVNWGWERNFKPGKEELYQMWVAYKHEGPSRQLFAPRLAERFLVENSSQIKQLFLNLKRCAKERKRPLDVNYGCEADKRNDTFPNFYRILENPLKKCLKI